MQATILHDVTGDWLTMQAAAQVLDVSVDTIKRRVKRGELRARQEPTISGFRWLVYVAGAAPAAPAAPAACAAPADVPPVQPAPAAPAEPARAAPAPQPLQSLEQQRAEALAAYGATLLAPVLATVERLEAANRDLARENGTLRERLVAAEVSATGQLETNNPPATPPADASAPWWQRWVWWRRR